MSEREDVEALAAEVRTLGDELAQMLGSPLLSVTVSS